MFPQAPHVSQFVESSTLSITVLLGVLGVGEGVGVGVGVGDGRGVGVGVGVGDGLGVGVGVGLGAGVGAGAVAGVGEGVGDGLAASVGAVELLATMLPPQPVRAMVNVIDAKIKPSKATSERLQRKSPPRKLAWKKRRGENSSGRMMLLDYAGDLRLSPFSPEIKLLKLEVSGLLGEGSQTKVTCCCTTRWREFYVGRPEP